MNIEVCSEENEQKKVPRGEGSLSLNRGEAASRAPGSGAQGLAMSTHCPQVGPSETEGVLPNGAGEGLEPGRKAALARGMALCLPRNRVHPHTQGRLTPEKVQ